jgi:hypothetical protein
LDSICKIYERNRKQKKKRRKEKKNMKWTRGETFQPSREKEPAAHLLIPEPVPYPTLSL